MGAPEMMRFFTRQWRVGELSDADFEARAEVYRRHLDSLISGLPSRLGELAMNVALNDANVQSAAYVAGEHTFLLVLHAGDLQRGYAHLTLRYSGVTAIAPLSEWGGLEIVADEIDLSGAPGQFVHRFAFENDAELAVTFSGFDYTLRPE